MEVTLPSCHTKEIHCAPKWGWNKRIFNIRRNQMCFFLAINCCVIRPESRAFQFAETSVVCSHAKFTEHTWACFLEPRFCSSCWNRQNTACDTRPQKSGNPASSQCWFVNIRWGFLCALSPKEPATMMDMFSYLHRGCPWLLGIWNVAGATAELDFKMLFHVN